MIDNKNIVLTGAGSGIGLAVLKQLKGRGNRILAVALDVSALKGMKGVIPMECDVSTAEGVETVFRKAEELFGKIDIFYANAGFAYIEDYDYTDWERIDRIFRTNTYSPIYSYARYLKHLNGRNGTFVTTISAIGRMGMPGYTLYTATKFALNGFQDAVRLEKPKNLRLVCVYPVATNTNFFRAGGGDQKNFRRPFPVQEPETVAKKVVRGIERGKDEISPCFLFDLSRVLMAVCPPVRTLYRGIEKKKFTYNKRLKEAETASGKER